jgi:hypothetical protein
MSWTLNLDGDAGTVLINLKKLQNAVDMALDDLGNCEPDDMVLIDIDGYVTEASEELPFGFGVSYNFHRRS